MYVQTLELHISKVVLKRSFFLMRKLAKRLDLPMIKQLSKHQAKN